MMPNLHIQEQFVRERIQERHREAEQARMQARLPRSRSRVAGSLILLQKITWVSILAQCGQRWRKRWQCGRATR